MKKFLALAVACTLMVTSSVCVFAEENTTGGNAEPTPSRLAKDLEEKTKENEQLNEQNKQLQEQIDSLNELKEQIKGQNDLLKERDAANNSKIESQNNQINSLGNQINALNNQIKAIESKNSSLSSQLKTAQKNYDEANKLKDKYEEKYRNATKSSGRSSRSENSSRIQALSKNNAIGDGYGGYIAQGGHVQINGGKSNVTFTLSIPSSAIVNSASSYASNIGGTLLYCVSTSSPGVTFKNAVVNFTITGVPANDTIAAYQLQGKNWVQVRVVSVTNNHVNVELTQHGPIAFVRVAAVANASH